MQSSLPYMNDNFNIYLAPCHDILWVKKIKMSVIAICTSQLLVVTSIYKSHPPISQTPFTKQPYFDNHITFRSFYKFNFVLSLFKTPYIHSLIAFVVILFVSLVIVNFSGCKWYTGIPFSYDYGSFYIRT